MLSQPEQDLDPQQLPSQTRSESDGGTADRRGANPSELSFFGLSPNARIVQKCRDHFHILDIKEDRLELSTISGSDDMLALLYLMIPDVSSERAYLFLLLLAASRSNSNREDNTVGEMEEGVSMDRTSGTSDADVAQAAEVNPPIAPTKEEQQEEQQEEESDSQRQCRIM